MTLLVCGSRRWPHFSAVKKHIAAVSPTLIIQGAARGADSMAVAAAAQLGVEVVSFRADWQKHGRRAGPIRNREMLEFLIKQPEPRMVLAFWDGVSRGTASMIWIACAANVPVRIVKPDGIIRDVGPGWDDDE